MGVTSETVVHIKIKILLNYVYFQNDAFIKYYIFNIVFALSLFRVINNKVSRWKQELLATTKYRITYSIG